MKRVYSESQTCVNETRRKQIKMEEKKKTAEDDMKEVQNIIKQGDPEQLTSWLQQHNQLTTYKKRSQLEITASLESMFIDETHANIAASLGLLSMLQHLHNSFNVSPSSSGTSISRNKWPFTSVAMDMGQQFMDTCICITNTFTGNGVEKKTLHGCRLVMYEKHQ